MGSIHVNIKGDQDGANTLLNGPTEGSLIKNVRTKEDVHRYVCIYVYVKKATMCYVDSKEHKQEFTHSPEPLASGS